jgi:hypothetical protein
VGVLGFFESGEFDRSNEILSDSSSVFSSSWSLQKIETNKNDYSVRYLPVIDFNWLAGVPDTGREIVFDGFTFRVTVLEGSTGTETDVVGFLEVFEGKTGSCTLAWSINVPWLNQQ